VLTIFCWKISASQLNPAVTLAFIFRDDSRKIHLSLGLLMMAAQVAGAYFGALYMTFIEWKAEPMVPNSINEKGNPVWFPALMQEILGTFIFVVFFKIVTDEKLYFSKEQALNCLIIASSYIAARSIVYGTGNSPTTTISYYGPCLNPAIAIGISLVTLMFEVGTTFKWFWLYWFMPFVGSLIAIIFYRFVYLKT